MKAYGEYKRSTYNCDGYGNHKLMSYSTKIRRYPLELEIDDFRLDEGKPYFKYQILNLSNSFP